MSTDSEHLGQAVATQDSDGSDQPPTPSTAVTLNRWTRSVALHLLPAVVLLALWQIVATFKIYDPLVVQSPRKVWDAFVEMLEDGTIQANLWPTLEACFSALLLSAVVGIPIGLILALLPRTEKIVNPYLDAINSAPRIAFAPVFIIVFGLTQSAKVALAFSHAVFIFIVNSRAGVDTVDPDLRDLMRSGSASRRQLFTKLFLPSAVPAIFAAVRLGIIASLLGVVASEIIAATAGMGMLVAQYSSTFQLSKVYAIILVLVVVATIINVLAKKVEQYLTRWKR